MIKKKIRQKQHLSCGDACLHSRSQEESTQTVQWDRRKSCWTMEKGRNGDGSKWLSRRMVRLCDGMFFTGGTSTTKWPMARRRTRTLLGVTFDGPLIAFGAGVSHTPISFNDVLGCISSVKHVSWNIHAWVRSHVREEAGQVLSHLRSFGKLVSLLHIRTQVQFPRSRIRTNAVVSQILLPSSTSPSRTARWAKPRAR